jgi:DNA repair exonuclease SbcCD ATPase subunit
LKKDNYRNKITTLNNPSNNELGFSLKTEILAALQPLLAKAKKTDNSKFREVIESLLSNPDENGLSSVKQYLPAAGIFGTVISLVGSLVITEKKITKDDLNQFTSKVMQYFNQYEKLNAINEQFARQSQNLLERIEENKQDLKDFLVECICTFHRTMTKQSLKEIPAELMIQKFYDPQKLQSWLDTMKFKPDMVIFPPDAPTSIKLLTSEIKKLQKEFEQVYNDNYNSLKELITSLKNTIPNLDQNQLDKTNTELNRLYTDSRQADLINLNISQVDERMNTACGIINAYY